ncbi:5-methyltetrahydropteroyltriglutamate--homocysteine S-methyltransferase [Mucilaginibacter myungsuensis]|uniref:5-methyltetrahydropteroyltriglutamate--homocysteine methyltransferase n=1 Tax=Mucilaginibacter myungsuensis TaxID=649104 RepID=A0A929KZG3_9SPHI|nr:5-methyltetrahydropteroyltriglutamate--homocysteine S-methyltransferase [Mucilaginibacter myungsuensis]MBE9664556.1 5-methyltetrahydropteroyltriglutamate--homocysteine S-methyltransferase [Mucilaginibacter myungsuensis]MDN3601094.1 5-methyltetrahydropteroyltriglutamate--homocysteine S-methyltransferase [Mucilaginibacter myungsuensis]
MLTQNLGYPRIGNQRELKKACEAYWAGKSGLKNVMTAGKAIRHHNWQLQKDAGIDLIPSNDFSYYDQVLDHSLLFGAIPKRYNEVITKNGGEELDLYFAMARGYQKDGLDVTAMEMTKWFDTNYHYIVPEFYKDQQFKLFSTKVIDEFYDAKQLGIITKPVLIGPVSYLLLGKEKEAGFSKIDLLRNLLPVYMEVITKLKNLGAEWIQFDEPFLAMDLTEKEKQAFREAYKAIRAEFPYLKVLLATYFEALGDNTALATSLPVNALHIDLVRGPQQLDEVIAQLSKDTILSLGVLDGRNIWKNDLEASLQFINKAITAIGADRVWIAPSCSLIHSPCDLDNEKKEDVLTSEIKQWLSFARQKVDEVVTLKKLASGQPSNSALQQLEANKKAQAERRSSTLIHNPQVKERVAGITDADSQRANSFATRKIVQQDLLQLPLFATTTIGSFPQTAEVRSWRASYKKGSLTDEQYDRLIADETAKAVKWQEEIGLDVLVHGEFERNDMVEYFGEQLDGFTFTQNGWVQSYGSRCVKPPVIYGDVSRPVAMTVKWSAYAASLTQKWMKGMLTGPVTILQWSFVRNDQPRSATCTQIALAIRDEVVDLETAGIKIIQIDEPAIREGLPLRKADRENYLYWAVKAFRISASGVQDDTQIHTHMCYSEFNDIISNIADMDADVITIETSRSQMELLDVFADFKYPNEIGPGVYDIHSPRVPNRAEMGHLLKKAAAVIPESQLWVNPDCGLKTRGWDETKAALIEMVAAANEMRETVKQEA